MSTIKKSLTIKTSNNLNEIYDDIYMKLFNENKFHKFKPLIKKFAVTFYESDYLGVQEYTKCGIELVKKASKLKKPIYLVHGRRSNTYAFFIGELRTITKILAEEQRKLGLIYELKDSIKPINSADASLLAYLVLCPNKKKCEAALQLLSSEFIDLGKCLLNVPGKYSKAVKKQADIYREWAIYKHSATPKRKYLNVTNLVKHT